MKNIDTFLKKEAIKPKRPLKTTFSSSVLEAAHERKTQRKNWFARVFNHSPALNVGMAALAIFVVAGGTAAALVLWPKAEVTPRYVQTLPNGNRVLAVSATDCNYFSQPTTTKPSKDYIYYEVKKESKLTNAELIDSIQASCEEKNVYDATQDIIMKLPKHDAMNTPVYTVDSISKDSLTISLDPHYDPSVYIAQQETYTRFAKDLQVFDGKNESSYRDIKKGDSIALVARDTSGISSETPGNSNPMEHSERIEIVAIVKVPPLSGDPSILTSAFGTDIVRLDPCDDASGFCRAYEFVN